ncbi:MAG: tetratricopeptide repeat protein [Tepidisphaeraceae bacterium]
MGARRRTILYLFLLAACVFITFGRVVGHGFVNFDDERFIQQNPDFNPPQWSKLIRYWRGPYYGGAFPVTYMALGGIAAVARDANTGQLDPRVFHLVSVALHLACVILVFLILRLLVRDEPAAALGAAVFAVHPLQVECVAWVTNINTLLQAVFALAALWAYLVYAMRERDGERGRRVRAPLIISTVAYVLAMLNKPIAVTLPIVAAAMDVALVGRHWRKVVAPTVLWLAMAIPVVIAIKLMINQPAVFHSPLWARPIVALDAIGFYLVKLVAPTQLTVDYGRSPQWLLAQPAFAWMWAVAAAAGVIVLLLRRRAPWLVVAAVAFVAPLLPVLGLVDFHFQRYSTVADRYVYVSMLGVAMAIAFVLTRVRRPAVARGAWMVTVVALAAVSIRQSAYWRDTATLFTHARDVNPNSFAARGILGYLARQQGDNVRASDHYLAALVVYPDDATTNFNLARVLVDLGQFDRAIRHFERALAAKPDDPQFRNNYGVALFRAGRRDEAVVQLEAVLAKNPGFVDAAKNLAIVRASPPPASQPVP